jgi:hypothetical protein
MHYSFLLKYNPIVFCGNIWIVEESKLKGGGYMERLYKTYVTSLCCIILGQLILFNWGTTPNYIFIAIILIILLQ